MKSQVTFAAVFQFTSLVKFYCNRCCLTLVTFLAVTFSPLSLMKKHVCLLLRPSALSLCFLGFRPEPSVTETLPSSVSRPQFLAFAQRGDMLIIHFAHCYPPGNDETKCQRRGNTGPIQCESMLGHSTGNENWTVMRLNLF